MNESQELNQNWDRLGHYVLKELERLTASSNHLMQVVTEIKEGMSKFVHVEKRIDLLEIEMEKLKAFRIQAVTVFSIAQVAISCLTYIFFKK